jgi:hypothetical protein
MESFRIDHEQRAAASGYNGYVIGIELRELFVFRRALDQRAPLIPQLHVPKVTQPQAFTHNSHVTSPRLVSALARELGVDRVRMAVLPLGTPCPISSQHQTPQDPETNKSHTISSQPPNGSQTSTPKAKPPSTRASTCQANGPGR